MRRASSGVSGTGYQEEVLCSGVGSEGSVGTTSDLIAAPIGHLSFIELLVVISHRRRMLQLESKHNTDTIPVHRCVSYPRCCY